MKRLIIPLTLLCTIIQCQEEKPILEQAIEARCECLKSYDKKKNNIIEVMECSDEVNARPEFEGLNQAQVMAGMEITCPVAALAFDELML